jgi:hypothetical protein
MSNDSTAHHEAAHAVVTYRLTGHVGGHVSIVPRSERGTLGHVTDGVSDSTSPDDMEAFIVSCYAGGHAQRIIDPSCGNEGCEQDEDLAREQLRLFGWELRDQELRERSLSLVRKHWTEIVAVAAELQCVQVLEDAEVGMIADAAAGDPDANLALAQYRAVFGDLDAWRAQHLDDANKKGV